jgi:D-methionine transport system permease protein
VPFIILMILLFRVFRFIAPGETWTSVIAPLTISAIPFVTQTVENAFARVNLNIIHAARAMGSTDFQIVKKVLIPEALSGLISGLTLTIINLLGYSAAAGALWGCGLGGLIIQSNVPLTAAAGVIILLLIESVQILGALATRNIAISK